MKNMSLIDRLRAGLAHRSRSDANTDLPDPSDGRVVATPPVARAMPPDPTGLGRRFLKTEVLDVSPGFPLLAWLIIQRGPHAGREYRISGDVTIGRSADACDIVVDDEAVSGQHARIKLEDGILALYDLASTNGTFVNQELILKSPLMDGDIVQIGGVIFVFKTAYDQGDVQQWHQIISDRLWQMGRVSVNDLDAVPKGYRRRILEGYADAHPEWDLELREDGTILAFCSRQESTLCLAAWNDFLFAQEQSARADAAARVVQALSTVLATTHSNSEITDDKDLWVSALDVSLIFEGLNVSAWLPLILLPRELLSAQIITAVRHQLMYQGSQSWCVGLILLPVSPAELANIQEMLNESLRKPYALDVVATSIEEILRIIVSKRPRDQFRHLILSKIELRTVSPFVLIFRSVGQGLSNRLSAGRKGRAFTSMLAEIER